ncbi:hypothetical protein E2C01_064865 [Portunus trituberculatus]|uniref:Uncharacterized protein n=1 Tax=Portunus trituberculatus TaxID=210409 RepID=A0A5B7HCZ5_PORTR|nr:hypothetical protein [Portunus trituberculatus]
MEEIDEKDVSELLTSHEQELTNEELIAIEQKRAVEEEAAATEEEDATGQHYLTRKILAEAFIEIESGMQKNDDNDPDRERSLKLERNIQYALAAYKQLRLNLCCYISHTGATADDFPDLLEATLPSILQDDDDDDADSPQAYSMSTPLSTQ